MAATSAQVRASPMSDRLSFSVVAFAAQRRASSAYCRNWLASDMTALPVLAVPLNHGVCAYGTVESGQNRSLPGGKRSSGRCPFLRPVPYLNETLQFLPSAFFGFSLCRE